MDQRSQSGANYSHSVSIGITSPTSSDEPDLSTTLRIESSNNSEDNPTVTAPTSTSPNSSRGHGERRKRMLKASIWLKLTLFSSLLVLITSGSLAFIWWRITNYSIKNEVTSRLNTVATFRQQQILTFIQTSQSQMKMISSRILIGSLLYEYTLSNTSSGLNYTMGTNDFDSAFQSSENIIFAGAYSVNGSFLFSNTMPKGSVLSKQLPSELVLRSKADNYTWTSVTYKGPSGDLRFNLTTPVYVKGLLNGIIFSSMNCNRLVDLVYESSGLGETGQILIGYPSNNSTSINFLVSPQHNPNLTSIRFVGPIAHATMGRSGFVTERGYSGKVIAAAYRPIGISNWGLSAEISKSEAFKSFFDLQKFMLITTGSFFLFGVLASYALGKIFSRPITDLIHIAKALTEGDLNARTHQGSSICEDEIDTLRHVFNDMADQISVAHGTLEQKVLERTQELASANEGLGREVEERRSVERQLQEAKNAAVAADNAKSTWLANISHEIRTPLNGIINCTELCLDTSVTVEQSKYLNLCLFSAKHLLRLISDILDFSKIEAGKLNMETIQFSLFDQLEHAISVLSNRASVKGLKVHCKVCKGVPDQLTGDPVRLFQILINLMGNAIKFTDHGEVILTVKLNEKTSTYIELLISVKDSGIGIPKSKQALLFQAFSQLDSSTTRLYGGTGLGLVISSKLANAMNGRMWVESEEGKGSIFYFTARFTLPEAEDDGLVRTKPKPVESNLRGKALILERSITDCNILCEFLNGWEIEAMPVHDVDSAIHELESSAKKGNHYNYLFVDLHIPFRTSSSGSGNRTKPNTHVRHCLSDSVLLSNSSPSRSFFSSYSTLTSSPRKEQVDIKGCKKMIAFLESNRDIIKTKRKETKSQRYSEGFMLNAGSHSDTCQKADKDSLDFVPGYCIPKSINSYHHDDKEYAFKDPMHDVKYSFSSPPSEYPSPPPQHPPPPLHVSESDNAQSTSMISMPMSASQPSVQVRELDLCQMDGLRNHEIEPDTSESSGDEKVVLRDMTLSHSEPLTSKHESDANLMDKDDINGLILLTSLDHGDHAICRQLGIKNYISKPIKREVLLRSILATIGIIQPEQDASKGSHGLEQSMKEKKTILHVLVVEDNPINQKVALTFLKKWGCSSSLASNGLEAFEKIKNENFGVVLMDVQMPVCDGLKATKLIREWESNFNKHTPIVAMTANVMAGDGDKCRDAGMDFYITKPLNSAKLQQVLEVFLDSNSPKSMKTKLNSLNEKQKKTFS